MAKKKGCDCEPGLPAWMATFSDMMTLLLTFFVLLLSMSSLDQQRIKEALGSLKGSLGVLHGGTKTEVNVRELLPSLEMVEVSPRQLVDKDYERIRLELYRKKIENKIQADRTEMGILLHIDSSVLFGPGQGALGGEAQDVLKGVADILRETRWQVRVEGHTDNVPIHTKRFPSNWELSTARAVNTLRFFVEKESMEAARFSAVGYGETQPIASNEDADGRARNRRVTVVLLEPPGVKKERAQTGGSRRRSGKVRADRPGFSFSLNMKRQVLEKARGGE